MRNSWGRKPGRETRSRLPVFPPIRRKCCARDARRAGCALWTGICVPVRAVEVGVAWALAGLADTGTCVVPSTDEDVRLATMLPETGVILLRCSQILPCLEDSGALLRELFSGDGSTFVAFISGPSRTADIERVLTLGVHGPLALHAVLINDVPQERVQ